ncbi:MAG: hypothetical protein M3N53_13415 [Actinomycetota bacterium]|nr:hypothetical protein [Actinomycetota bacterium]
MATGASGPSRVDGAALIDCLNDVPSALAVPHRLNRDLRAHVNATIPGLRNGIDDEIVQQTWIHLVRLDRRRIRRSRDVVGLAKWFLRSYAVREVFDGYTPPGRKKRERPAVGELPPLSMDAESGDGVMTMAEVLDASRCLGEGVDLCDAALARVALARAAKTAPPFVAQALALIYYEGLSNNAAAARVGVDHKTLERAIASWATAQGLNVDGPGPGLGAPKTVAPRRHSSGRRTDCARPVPGNSRSDLVRVA